MKKNKFLTTNILGLFLSAFLLSPVFAQSFESEAKSLASKAQNLISTPVDLSGIMVIPFDGVIDFDYVNSAGKNTSFWGRINIVLDMTEGNVTAEVYSIESSEDLGSFVQTSVLLEGYVTSDDNGFLDVYFEHELGRIGDIRESTFIELRAEGRIVGGTTPVIYGPIVGELRVGRSLGQPLLGSYVAQVPN
jgi:hypothetical protein